MKSNVLTLLLIFSSLTVSLAQSVKGTINDQDNLPQPFANIIVYNAETNTPIIGAISDNNGKYEFTL